MNQTTQTICRTHLDAKRIAAEYVLRSEKGRIIREALDKTNGNVTRAMELIWQNGDAARLGGWGFAGPDRPRVSCYHSASTTPISIWMPGTPYTTEPDLIMEWREVFQYAQTGRLVTQLDLL